MTGLWHGANWNYILWGLYYFVFLTLEMFLQPVFKKIFTGFTGKFLSRIYFAVITVFGMAIFSFESETFKNLGYLFGVGTGAVSYTHLDVYKRQTYVVKRFIMNIISEIGKTSCIRLNVLSALIFIVCHIVSYNCMPQSIRNKSAVIIAHVCRLYKKMCIRDRFPDNTLSDRS